MSAELGEPYFFVLGPNVWGYGATPEAAIKQAKLAGVPRAAGTKVKMRVYGPCLDAHDIGCSLMNGEVRWKVEDADGNALPEVKWEDREVRVR